MGDRGPAVRDLQRRLNRVRDTDLPVDGIFSEDTARAVQAFQRDRGLAADGTVGPETWRSLVEAGFKLGDRLLWHSRVMMRGDDVRELQQRLNVLGFNAGPEDGLFGPATQAAMEEFQRNVGIDVDGVAGASTVAMLRRLEREHHATGTAARAREREALRALVHRGLGGSRILVDPAHGPGDPGNRGQTAAEHKLTWAIAVQLAGQLRARGAVALLSRGPRTTPTASERARFANEQGVALVVSIGLNALTNPHARGCASYYYGTDRFVSEGGRELAESLQSEMIAAGWGPDCRSHPMTWAILRETRMPAVVLEPAFITNVADEIRLSDPGAQRRLAAGLVGGLERFLRAPDLETIP